MKFYSIHIIIILGLITLINNTLNASAYISEIINNTDQTIGLSYQVPVTIEIGTPVKSSNELSATFQRALTTSFSRIYGTLILLEKRTKIALRGAYLPYEQNNVVGVFENGIRLYVAPPKDDNASVWPLHPYDNYFCLGNEPFVKIRQRNDWAECLNRNIPLNPIQETFCQNREASIWAQCLKRISSEPIINGESYTLEINQTSSEVYKMTVGNRMRVSEDAIEIVIKKNKSNTISESKTISENKNKQIAKSPHASIIAWAPQVIASADILMRNPSLKQQQDRLPILVTISFDKEVTNDFIDKFFTYLSNRNINRIRRKSEGNKNHFFVTVNRTMKQEDFQSILNQANSYFETIE